jgi:formylglycine-generating enzyme
MRPMHRRPTGPGLVALFAALGCRPSDAAPRPTGSAPPQAVADPSASNLSPPPSSTPAALPSVFPSPAPAASATAGCPAGMARVAGFCMDRYEAHLARLGEDGTVTPHPPYQRPEKDRRYVAQSTPGVMPQAYINRPEAEDACQRAQKRLCTAGEWYRACIGPRGWPFPYGVEEQPRVCNTKKPHLLSRLYGSDPRGWKYDEHFNDPALDQEPGFLAKTGEHTGCVSLEGVYDLVGNLHEWVSDRVDDSLPEKVPLLPNLVRKLGRNHGHGIFMGGFFSTGSEHGRGCAFVTIGHEPKYHDYSTGFRCCRNVAL